jgi:hypothetical protein
MNKRTILAIILVAIIAGVLIGYVRGLPDDFVEAPGTDTASIDDYGYRCGDGSEFTLLPSEDMTTITLKPATSADYLRETVLQSASGGTTYAGNGVRIVVHGITLDLSTASTAPTTCTSMRPVTQSLFYIGD